jgi:16S rRNA (cytosine967-C5)-methyltransferase
MAISPARRIAFEVLCRVGSHGAYASDLLHTHLDARVSREDAALATEVTLGVLRWQRLLDFLIGRNLDRAVERLDPEVLIALRVGLYQVRFLERVPAHAAVGEAVELVKRARKYSAAGLVNAVLRRAVPDAKVSGKKLQALLPAEASFAERCAILHSHPTWLVERWIAQFGKDRAVMLLEANNRAAHVSCAVLDKDGVADVEKSIRENGFHTAPGRWLRTALTLSGGNLSTATAFRDGQITLQDEASQMVAHLLDARAGQSVLDLCSAPGGKTLILARAVGAGGSVTATDVHEHRLRAVREMLARTRTENVSLLALDAMLPLPFTAPASFSRILVDAPCTGTGTLARNPEIRWRLTLEDIASAHVRQATMLRNALALLAPGGKLVYATCSLEPEENDDVVREALAADPHVYLVSGVDALATHLRPGVPATSLFDRESFFRTFPPESGTDGFFAATLERRG